MITLALIGTGKWGRNYLSTATKLANVSIKYLCTRHISSLNEYSDNNFQKLTNFNDLYQFSDIDGVIIATPATTHFQIAKELLEKGYNLLIEKPLTLNINQANKLKNIWDKKKPVVLVGHTQLYNPAYLKLKQLLPTIGPVKKIVFQGLLSPAREDVSVLWDWGPHPVAIFLDLNNSKVSKITTKARKLNPENHFFDTLDATIIFDNQVETKMNISWYHKSKVRKLIVKGTLGTITIDDTQPENKISLKLAKKDTEYPSYGLKMPLEVELAEFVRAISLGNKVRSDLHFGIKVVELLTAIESTIVGDRKIKIKGHYNRF